MSDNGDAASVSEASSVAPAANGHHVGADQLAHHPVWAASRGRGGGGGGGGAGKGSGQRGAAFAAVGRGRGRGGGSENGDVGQPRFERISMAALEAGQFADADGAESRLESDEDEQDDSLRTIARSKKSSKVNGKRKAAADPQEALEEEGEEESESDDEGNSERRNKLQGLMGAAAFGGCGQRRFGGSEAGSMPSENSSARRREAYRDAFPVRGVTCVGCALANRIGPVNNFVRANISQMHDDSLWKMAALTYKRDVAEPTEREGAPVPSWSWKEVRAHYELHVTGNLVGRHKMIRSLQCMRHQAEERLVRVDGNDKELDRKNAELMLKIVQAESRERQLLEQQTGGKKRSWEGNGNN